MCQWVLHWVVVCDLVWMQYLLDVYSCKFSIIQIKSTYIFCHASFSPLSCFEMYNDFVLCCFNCTWKWHYFNPMQYFCHKNVEFYFLFQFSVSLLSLLTEIGEELVRAIDMFGQKPTHLLLVQCIGKLIVCTFLCAVCMSYAFCTSVLCSVSNWSLFTHKKNKIQHAHIVFDLSFVWSKQ